MFEKMEVSRRTATMSFPEPSTSIFVKDEPTSADEMETEISVKLEADQRFVKKEPTDVIEVESMTKQADVFVKKEPEEMDLIKERKLVKEANVFVKKEPGEVFLVENATISIEIQEVGVIQTSEVCVKKEDKNVGLYTDHQVKEELTLGPEQMHRPSVASAVQARITNSDGCYSCSVSLERVVKFGRYCRIGRRVYRLHTDPCDPTDPPDPTDPDYKCSHCHQIFNDEPELRGHYYSHLTPTLSSDNKIIYKCTQCSYTSAYKHNLITHEISHLGVKPFKCSLCGFKTSHQSSLRLHQRIHSGIKPFKCSQCDFKSTHKSNVYTHEKTHSGEKPFQCDICLNKFSQKGQLKRHIMSHTNTYKPYKCGFCSYRCRQKAHLQSHERTHTKVKPFKCSQCEYAAGYSNSLKLHIKRKHAEKLEIKVELEH